MAKYYTYNFVKIIYFALSVLLSNLVNYGASNPTLPCSAFELPTMIIIVYLDGLVLVYSSGNVLQLFTIATLTFFSVSFIFDMDLVSLIACV